MVSTRFGLWINASRRYRFGLNKPFCSNSKPTSDKGSKVDQGALTHHDSYRDLDKLDFMTAAKILFTTPPKQKKFGLDFHLVQLFFVCMPSLAVYLVAQYARSEMRRMDAELELRNKGKEAKAKEMEEKAAEEKARSDPQILEVKARLEKLEETVKEFVIGSKKQPEEEDARPLPENNGRKSEPNKSTGEVLQNKLVSKEIGQEHGSGQQETKQLAVATDASQKDLAVRQGGSPSADAKK